MTDRLRSATHPTVFPASPSTPTAPTTPGTTPTTPVAHTSLPSLSRPALEESGAHPLVRRARSGASRRSPPLRSTGASRRPMHHPQRLAISSTAPPPLAAPQPAPSSAGQSAPLSFPIPALPLRRSASACPPGVPLRIALRSALLISHRRPPDRSPAPFRSFRFFEHPGGHRNWFC